MEPEFFFLSRAVQNSQNKYTDLDTDSLRRMRFILHMDLYLCCSAEREPWLKTPYHIAATIVMEQHTLNIKQATNSSAQAFVALYSLDSDQLDYPLLYSYLN